MSLLPIKKIVLPSNLVGVEAGKLPSTMLIKVAGGGFLHPKAAKAWNALVAKAASEGIELKPTSAADLYRSYEVQKRGFLTRYQLEPIAGAKTRKFEGKTWYLKPKNAPMAAPGTSNHNLGIAIDVANANGKVLAWMRANIEAYGFSWELQEEPWHIRLVCGDDLPAVVTGA
jgi:LAS superfamily LD-carboxypeptidase LdcB